jgi:nucleotide-binding universal stress UspA family protein
LYNCLDLKKLVGEEIARLQTLAETDFPVSLTQGYIAQDTAELALKQQADLIVIGRGKTQTTFGSLRTHAYEVIRRAPCPVLSYSTDWQPSASNLSEDRLAIANSW